MKERLISWLNTALMINLFFVLLSFGWFAIALIGKSAHINLGFDLWYSLWDPLFMPAIGLLMAGAIVVGTTGWVSRKFFISPSNTSASAPLPTAADRGE